MPRELIKYSRKPWHRLAQESEAAWACFRAFLEQEVPRDPSRIVPPRDHPSACPQFIEHWHIEHDWQVRASAYDMYRFQNENASLDACARVSALRSIDAINEGFSFTFRELRKWNAISLDSGAPVLSAREVLPLLRSMIELKRLALGESTENIAVIVSGIPNLQESIDALSVEELEVLERIQQKALTK